MSGVLLYYFGVSVFVLLGQLAIVGVAWAIGRRLRRSGFAALFFIAYVVGVVRTVRSLPIYTSEEIAGLVDAYSSWPDLILAAGQPFALWLVFWALLMLYDDLPRRRL